MQTVAVLGDEQGLSARLRDQVGTNVVRPFFDPGQRACSDRNDAVFVVFALANGEDLALVAEIVNIQCDQLAAANAAGIKRFQNRAVADSQPRCDVGLVEKQLDLLGSQRRRW